MATIVIHRLRDWAISRHILPVLRAAGVPEEALGCVHYFYAAGVADPFRSIPETTGFPAAEDALLAASGALGAFAHAVCGAGEEDELTSGFHWSATEDQLVAAAKKRKHDVVLARGEVKARADGAGAAMDAQRANGATDAEVIEKLAKNEGGADDGTRGFALLSFFGRLDTLLAAGEATLRRLISASADLPPDQQSLAGYACAAFCSDERLSSLELATVKALSTMEHEALVKRAERAFRTRVLAAASPPLADLLDVFDDADGALKGKDRARFDALWKDAVARDEHTLEQWVYALNRSAVDRATFERHLVGPFRRAVEGGFTDKQGFGDRASFAESVRAVAAADPDLALAGFVALSKQFNENGLRTLLTDAKLLPRKGFSAGALASAAAAFSEPEQRSAVKIFAKLLASWGIEPKVAAPPALETIDHTFEVGTDVATLVVGSFDSVEKISATEDLDDCARLVRKTKSLGFMTGGDGWFSVRVLGVPDGRTASAQVAPGAKLLGVAPLHVTGDTLTVSGVVGGAGAPTIPFPSGTYAAEVFGHEDGPLSLTIVIRKDAKPPAWPFGKGDELPSL